jgi:CHAT domain-containing protein
MNVSPAGRYAAMTIIVSAVTAWMMLLPWRGAREDSPLQSLRRTANSLRYRSIEARLSGGFDYKPFEPVQRTRVDRSSTFVGVAGEARWEAKANSRPATLHIAGVAELLTDDIDRAIASLEQALAIDAHTDRLELAIARSQSADLLNDLACGYLTRGRRIGHEADFLRALPAAERAWQLSRASSAAWNRALAYEALYLTQEASAAWDDVVAHEPSPGWRSEAEHHRKKLSEVSRYELWSKEAPLLLDAVRKGDRPRIEQDARHYPAEVFAAGTDKLIAWAGAWQQRPQRAAEALRDAHFIAEALMPVDPFLHDAITAIENAQTAGERERLAHLVEGTRQLDRGRQLYEQRHLDEALQVLRASAVTLERESSCLSLAAQTLAASCLVFGKRYREAATEIDPVESNTRVRHRYRRAFAQSEWIAGLCHLALGRPYEALEAYARAREAFEHIGDLSDVAAIHDLEGEAYEHLGLGEESWRHRYRALAFYAMAGGNARSEAIFGGAARAAVKLGQYSAALQFVESVLAAKRGDAFALAELLVLRGAIRDRLGVAAEATEDFRRARTMLSRVPEGSAREAVASDIRVVELLIAARPATVRSAASAAIEDAQKQNNKFSLVPLLRLRAAATAGDRTQSVTDAETALAEMEQQLSTIHDQELRLTSQRSLHDLYGSLVAAAVDDGDVRRAVQLLDCERERSRLGSGVCHDVALDGLPAGVALLDYTIVDDTVFMFEYHDRTLTAHRISTSAALIDSRAREFMKAVRNGDDVTARVVAAALCADLFDPFVEDIRNATHIVISGSPARIALPYPALWSRRTGRYLVEDYTIVNTPGVSRLTAAVQRDRELRTHRRAALDVAAVAPEYDETLPPYLHTLPSAQREAVAVRELYRNGAALTGTAATRQSFADAAARAAVVHFAGHSVSNDERPQYAALALTSVGRTAAMLYAHEIAARPWGSTRLVVLASCSSAAKNEIASVGPMSLADAFLDAHVPAVVAALWAIDDGGATSLILDFHRNLRAGRAAPAALRLAQIAALRSGDPQRVRLQHWAPYCFMGWHSATEEK